MHLQIVNIRLLCSPPSSSGKIYRDPQRLKMVHVILGVLGGVASQVGRLVERVGDDITLDIQIPPEKVF